MKEIVTVREYVAEISHTYLPIKAIIFLFIDACCQVPLILLKKKEQKSLRLHGHFFSTWRREHVAFSIVSKDGQYYVSD